MWLSVRCDYNTDFTATWYGIMLNRCTRRNGTKRWTSNGSTWSGEKRRWICCVVITFRVSSKNKNQRIQTAVKICAKNGETNRFYPWHFHHGMYTLWCICVYICVSRLKNTLSLIIKDFWANCEKQIQKILQKSVCVHFVEECKTKEVGKIDFILWIWMVLAKKALGIFLNIYSLELIWHNVKCGFLWIFYLELSFDGVPNNVLLIFSVVLEARRLLLGLARSFAKNYKLIFQISIINRLNFYTIYWAFEISFKFRWLFEYIN